MPLSSLLKSALRAPVARSLKARLADFHHDEGGAVAVLVAAAIIPLVGALGLATDTARGYMVKARLSQALDAAALAGGKVMLSSDAVRDADIQMFFDANFPPGFMGATVSPLAISENVAGDVLSVSADATINTTFMRVLGFDTLTVAAETEVTREVEQLDLVLSIDTSGSMGQPMSKIEGARDAAQELLDILFGDNTVSPTVTISGTTYNLLNIGVVNWNSKANVTIAGEAYDSSETTAETVPEFTNPVTGAPQTVLYYANNSPVPLLSAPDANWEGCVYARYTGNSTSGSSVGNDDDADFYLGQVENLNGHAYADWLGWEPIPTLEGEPRSGSWSGSAPDNEPSGGYGWRNTNRSCYGAYWNDNLADPNHPVAVPDKPAWWYTSAPTINNAASSDCAACPAVGILPLETEKQVISDLIDTLTPGGTTNIPTGLAWAWEVLMPSVPFDEAEETLPFPRNRAIVLLTDGENNGGNGDAYKGRFGSGTAAGTTTNSAHGYLPSPPDAVNTRNNLNNRLKRLAANIKGSGGGGVELYVIQFDENSPTLTALLSSVASEPNAPYYFNAPTVEELQAAFREIANNLSRLRLTK